MIDPNKFETPWTRVYAIFDIKAKKYNLPFYQSTHEVAMRSFADACRNPKDIIVKHPEDFQLFYLCSYNEHLGCFTSEITPTYLASALDYIVPENNHLLEADKS